MLSNTIHRINEDIPSGRAPRTFKHFLHLYTKEVDIYAIQREFLFSLDTDAVVVLSSEKDIVEDELGSIISNLVTLEPEEFNLIEESMLHTPRLAVIVDVGSFSDQSEDSCIRRERGIVEMGKSYLNENLLGCLCMYDMEKLSKELLHKLISFHNLYKLTTNNITFVSGDKMDSSVISNETIQKIVKDNLEAIILTLLHREVMCGTDIISTIHKNFNILLSPGTIYPLLHSLDEEGLVTWIRDGKEKRYMPIKGSYSEVRSRLLENIKAQKWFARFLQKELDTREDLGIFETQLRCEV